MRPRKSRIRLFSPIGIYPSSGFSYGRSVFEINSEIVFSSLTIHDPGRYGLTAEHHSEIEFLSLEEIRFLAAITLSLRPDNGMVCLYPIPEHLDMSVQPKRNQNELLEIAREFAQSIQSNSYIADRATLPPLLGGPQYSNNDYLRENWVAKSVIRNVNLGDHLLIRGLGALLKSDMLMMRKEFQDAALNSLHIAMEASFQLTLRLLRERGNKKPSALDAGAFIDSAFGASQPSGKYFHEYYEDRVKSVHPTNRYGIFPYPPMYADDLYDLRPNLIAVFVLLITGRSWTDLWQ